MSDFQHFAKSSLDKGLSCRALADTIVTISDIADFSSIYQNIRTLRNSRYKLIKNSDKKIVEYIILIMVIRFPKNI